MNNPHIIVGPNRMCLCGMYSGNPMMCPEIISLLKNLNPAMAWDADTQDRTATMVLAFESLIQDCSTPMPSETTAHTDGGAK